MSLNPPGTSQRDRVLIAIARGMTNASAIQMFCDIPIASAARACQELRDLGLVTRVDARPLPGHPAEWALTTQGAQVAKVGRRVLQPRYEPQPPASEREAILMRATIQKGSALLLQSLRDQLGDMPPPPPPAPPRRGRFIVRRHPVAAGRDPCKRCATRGDVGCRHQRPAGPSTASPSGDDKGNTGAVSRRRQPRPIDTAAQNGRAQLLGDGTHFAMARWTASGWMHCLTNLPLAFEPTEVLL